MQSRKRFAELQQQVDRLQSQYDRAKGSLDRSLADLKAEFGVDSVPKANKLLSEKENEIAELDEELQTSMGKFEKKWKEYL